VQGIILLYKVLNLLMHIFNKFLHFFFSNNLLLGWPRILINFFICCLPVNFSEVRITCILLSLFHHKRLPINDLFILLNVRDMFLYCRVSRILLAFIIRLALHIKLLGRYIFLYRFLQHYVYQFTFKFSSLRMHCVMRANCMMLRVRYCCGTCSSQLIIDLNWWLVWLYLIYFWLCCWVFPMLDLW
jgi:hypothetical protein